MKRFIGIALSVVMFISIMAAPAQVGAYSDHEYGETFMWGAKDPEYYENYGKEFAGDLNIDFICISSSVRSIPQACFEGCINLSEIRMGDNIQRIGKNAFKATAYYSDSKNWSDGVLYLGDCLIEADPNQIGEEYTVKDDTRLIADGAFEGCKNLKSISIPDTVRYVGEDAFANTAFYNTSENWKDGFLFAGEYLIDVKPEQMKGEIIIPDNTRCVADTTFEGCKDASSVIFPDSVKYVGNSVFLLCQNLVSISFGKGFKEIGSKAFEGCDSLSEITVDGFNEHFTVNGGILYDKAQTRLIRCPAKLEGCPLIPESVTEIEPVAFKDCDKVEYVTLPSGCQYVGEYAFADCDLLKSVVFGDEVCIIGNYAFFDCDIIEKVVIRSERLESLGVHAFEGSKSLCDVSIFSRRLQALTEGVFKNCVSLKNVDIFYVSEVASDAFEGSGVITEESEWAQGMLIVGGCYLIKVAAGTTDCVIPDGICAVADGAFSEAADTLMSVRVPGSLRGFREAAFGCLGYNTRVIYNGTIDSFISNSDFQWDIINLTTKELKINTTAIFIFIIIAFGIVLLMFWYDDKATVRECRKRSEEQKAQKEAAEQSTDDINSGSFNQERCGSKEENGENDAVAENKGGN